MSRRKLRTEKDCLNCGARVEARYCSSYGQENIINRPSFFYLFTAFFQNLINYDSNFWRTLKTLLFKPGVIVLMYLVGRRKTYVNPIKLYFCVSLIAFLVPELFKQPNALESEEDKISAQVNLMEKMRPEAQQLFVLYSLDTIQQTLSAELKTDSVYFQKIKPIIKSSSFYFTDQSDTSNYKKRYKFGQTSFSIHDDSIYGKARDVQEFDSIHQSLAKERRMGWSKRILTRKLLEKENQDVVTSGLFIDRFKSSFYANFPKVLIFYLPVFAFILWLFHNKKKWKYYDHGVFTLYFFSFLLIAISVGWLADWLLSFLSDSFPLTTIILGFLIFFPGYLYLFFYFFRAHSKVYGDKKWISRLKAFMILNINIFLFLTVLVFFTIYTFWMI